LANLGPVAYTERGDAAVQVCVVGPGALGSLHAYLLARAGVPVSLLDHRPDRAALINERGLLVEEDGEVATVRVRCSAAPEELPCPDVLILCVKTFQTGAAARHAAPLVGPDTVVLRIQNGLASPEGLLRLAPVERIVLGVSGQGAHVIEWGHVRRAGSGPTRIGPWQPEGLPAAERAAEALRPAFPDIEVCPDVLPALWQKLLMNAAINPLTALTGLRNGQLLEVPLLRAALCDAGSEAERVARARGVELPPGRAALEAEAACVATAENRSSMLQDVCAGRRTEIEEICGAVVREAEIAGETAPLNRALVWLVAEVLPGGGRKRGGPT
jgi:2-dehydropantoate 2-reductase